MPERLLLGSGEHKVRFCQLFIDTHVPYDPESVEWPILSEGERRLLVNLPIWDEAVNTERETADRVRLMAEHEPDPVLAGAMALQAFEEERHSALLTALTDTYGIAVQRRPAPVASHPTWGFVRASWGECIDSFFAFGVFAVAREMAIFAPGLLELFDRVMQEEARHIHFFENWRLYRRRSAPTLPAAGQTMLGSLCAAAVVAERLRMAASGARNGPPDRENFVMAGARTLGGLSLRDFVDTCLSENERRLSPLDPELPRPSVVPTMVRVLRRFLPDRSA